MKRVLEQARVRVTPTRTAERRKAQTARTALELVGGAISGHPEIIGAEFGGSYPKGTWLPERADVDIFVRFTVSTPEKRFAALAKKIGLAALGGHGPYMRFSEHPYVEAVIDGTKVNVVPCYNVARGEWRSSADRSRFHTEFMLENLTGAMKSDVRLLKRFLRSNNIYGSEISRQGFSGYISEVLVWNFNSFEGVVRSIAAAKPGQVIGTAAKEFDTALVITDPIDPNRNLAAAISVENVGRFVLLCRRFLKKPSASYFGKAGQKTGRGLLRNCVIVEFDYTARSPDIIWGQVKSAATALSVQFKLGGYTVIRSGAHADEEGKAHLLFLLESVDIPKHYVRGGPDFFSESDSERFVAKNSGAKLVWVGDNGKIQSLRERSHSDARRFIGALLRDRLARSGIPDGIRGDVKRGFRIYVPAKAGKSVKAPLQELISTDASVFPSR